MKLGRYASNYQIQASVLSFIFSFATVWWQMTLPQVT